MADTPKTRTDGPQVTNEEAPVGANALTGLSSQPQFSTYKENTDVPDDNPAPGPQVVQELGKARKGEVEAR